MLPFIPIGINYLIGKRSSFFELGLGATYASGNLEFTSINN